MIKKENDNRIFNTKIGNLLLGASRKEQIIVVDGFKEYVERRGLQLGAEVCRALLLYSKFRDKTDKAENEIFSTLLDNDKTPENPENNAS